MFTAKINFIKLVIMLSTFRAMCTIYARWPMSHWLSNVRHQVRGMLRAFAAYCGKPTQQFRTTL